MWLASGMFVIGLCKPQCWVFSPSSSPSRPWVGSSDAERPSQCSSERANFPPFHPRRRRMAPHGKLHG